MIRLAALILAIAFSAEARAAPPTPVCRVPTVVDVMTRELTTRAYYARLDPALIEEAPTSDPRMMRCGVCVRIVLFDTRQYGDQPVSRCELHTFSVQAVRNGFVVRYLQ